MVTLEQDTERPWYRSKLLQVIAFFVFLPLWSLLVLADPRSGFGLRVAGFILGILSVLSVVSLVLEVIRTW